MSLGYRGDIQGLRGVAVLAVVVYHIWPSALPGGFLGVDVFFVVSGFLITAILLRRIDSKSERLLRDFYRGRVLRILPAVNLVLFTVVGIGAVIMTPGDLVDLASSAVFSALSLANVYFFGFLDTGYFESATEELPLLHFWSLGVEEQFYLLWPAVLILLVRVRRPGLLVAILSGTIAWSFAIAERALPEHEQFAYYLLPARAGQLLVGALLAVVSFSWAIRLAPPTRAALSGLGLSALLSLLFVQSEVDGFPGVSAIPISVATAAVLLAGDGGHTHLTSYLLASRPLTWFGDISFSLYLWHWPIAAFAAYAYIEFSLVSGAIAVALAVFLAAATYRFVEQPLRRAQLSLTRATLCFVALPLLLLGGFAFWARASNGTLTSTVAAEQEPLGQPAFSAPYVCQLKTVTRAEFDPGKCVAGVGGIESPGVLLWGDSNAGHFVGMIREFALEEGYAFRNVAHSACPPVFGESDDFVGPQKYKVSCTTSRGVVEAQLAEYHTVILAAVWIAYESNSDDFAPRVRETVERLVSEGHDVVLIGQLQHQGKLLDPDCARRGKRMVWLDCESLFTVPELAYPINDFLAQLADDIPNVLYFDPNPHLCRERRCTAYLGSELLYFDGGHLSARGSELLGRHIIDSVGVPAAFTRASIGE